MGGGLGLGGDVVFVLLLLPAAVVAIGRCGITLCLCTGVKLDVPTFTPPIPSLREEGVTDTANGRETAGEGEELEEAEETKIGPPPAGEAEAVLLIVIFLGSTGVEVLMEEAGPSIEPELAGLASGEGGLLDWIKPLAALLSRARACEMESSDGAPPKSSSSESERQIGSEGEGGR